MARAVDDIEKEIRALAAGEREQLLRALLEELDGPADPLVAQAWADEVRRRSRELEAGKEEPIPAEEAFARLRAQLIR